MFLIPDPSNQKREDIILLLNPTSYEKVYQINLRFNRYRFVGFLL